MFDDISKKPAPPAGLGQGATGENFGNPPVSRAEAEDIFADTEKGSGFGVPAPIKTEIPQPGQPVKPAIFQPVKPGDAAASAPSGGFFSSSKIKFIGLIVLALIFVIAGTWYVYTTTLAPGSKQAETVGNDVDAESGSKIDNEGSADIINEENNNQNAENEQAPVAEEPPIAPVVKDSDQDGLTDDEETALRTNISSNDTDSDGLFDREEVKTYLTDPLNKDTDGDGYIDGDEVNGGYNPRGAGKLLDINNSIKQ